MRKRFRFRWGISRLRKECFAAPSGSDFTDRLQLDEADSETNFALPTSSSSSASYIGGRNGAEISETVTRFAGPSQSAALSFPTYQCLILLLAQDVRGGSAAVAYEEGCNAEESHRGDGQHPAAALPDPREGSRALLRQRSQFRNGRKFHNLLPSNAELVTSPDNLPESSLRLGYLRRRHG